MTEEATKNAFIMPFISALGYDIFDPSEVVPEYTADIGTKKNEKVDYAILKDGQPIMFFECKRSGSELDSDYASQLYRYFATTSKTRIGVFTNGIIYHFYSDLDEQNIMDKKPFLEINMLDIQDHLINELKKLTKTSFNLDDIISTAAELKNMKETKRIFSEQIANPSEEFIRFFIKQIYPSSTATKRIVQQFTDIVKHSFNQFINDKINERLKSAMAEETAAAEKAEKLDIEQISEPETKKVIEIIPAELESFYIVKAIIHDMIDIDRISLRDHQTVCNIIIDNKASKSFVKLFMHVRKKHIVYIDGGKEFKVFVEKPDDIFKYSDKIKNSLDYFIKSKDKIEEHNNNL